MCNHTIFLACYPWLICRTVKFIDWSYGTARYPLKSSKAGAVSIIGFACLVFIVAPLFLFSFQTICFLGKHRVFSPVFTTASDILLD